MLSGSRPHQFHETQEEWCSRCGNPGRWWVFLPTKIDHLAGRQCEGVICGGSLIGTHKAAGWHKNLLVVEYEVFCTNGGRTFYSVSASGQRLLSESCSFGTKKPVNGQGKYIRYDWRVQSMKAIASQLGGTHKRVLSQPEKL